MSKQTSKAKIVIISILFLLVGLAGGFVGMNFCMLPPTDDVVVDEKNEDYEADIQTFGANLAIHFLELGNKYTGDCTYIKTPEADILIDCGSRASSIPVVTEYLNKYVTDGTLEFVIVTHAHRDHYAGFATGKNTDSIFDLYECETIIDFALTNQEDDATQYSNYQRELADEVKNGSKHYTALECVEEKNGAKKSYSIGTDMSLQILDSHFYRNTASSENNYSVCTLLTYCTHNFLFTGDLEGEGEKELVKLNNLPKVTMFKAGHHGSSTSTTTTLLDAIDPDVICVCCCAGSSEYTDATENQFPTQAFIDRVANYTNNVYITTMCVDYANDKFTSFNGNIAFLVKQGEYKVTCSNNNTSLKDTTWLRETRVVPSKWQ
ncbi:MAG: MBL fold metallo-hydrolase [Clostridia bacterium]|nr:MBL fold metallo-hydrolase [Clostridia bacterium]